MNIDSRLYAINRNHIISVCNKRRASARRSTTYAYAHISGKIYQQAERRWDTVTTGDKYTGPQISREPVRRGDVDYRTEPVTRTRRVRGGKRKRLAILNPQRLRLRWTINHLTYFCVFIYTYIQLLFIRWIIKVNQLLPVVVWNSQRNYAILNRYYKYYEFPIWFRR